jgi:hypothetical protein
MHPAALTHASFLLLVQPADPQTTFAGLSQSRFGRIASTTASFLLLVQPAVAPACSTLAGRGGRLPGSAPAAQVTAGTEGGSSSSSSRKSRQCQEVVCNTKHDKLVVMLQQDCNCTCICCRLQGVGMWVSWSCHTAAPSGSEFQCIADTHCLCCSHLWSPALLQHPLQHSSVTVTAGM